MGRKHVPVREIPWFRHRRPQWSRTPARRLSDVLEASVNEFDDAVGANMFTTPYTILTHQIEWADDPDMPAPYRVVRGWQDR